MKKIIFFLFVLLAPQVVLGQKTLTLNDSIAVYFQEIKVASKINFKLWNKDLYGPLIVVNPFTRQVYANCPDSAGMLRQNGTIFTGLLPNNIVIGNASINWSGVEWAMILMPFISPDNQQDRINLFAHELFHRVQSSLHLRPLEANNNHLDQKEGRIYLRLELEALLKAVLSTNSKEEKRHLTNALTFRKYRYLLFPGADLSENLLELNEGIAEYTGLMVAGRNKQQTCKHFSKKINEFFSNPSYVRSFPYYTIPVYGYLLHYSVNDWNKQINLKTNLSDYFVKAFRLVLPGDIKKVSNAILNQYNGEKIRMEENERQEKTKKLVAEYKTKFIEQPHFEISFEKKRVSFDSRFVVTVEDKGIVYPTMKATDNWGTLVVEHGGGLISPDRNKVTITVPTKIQGSEISGDGWTLKLNDGYNIKKDEKSGNYKLLKN